MTTTTLYKVDEVATYPKVKMKKLRRTRREGERELRGGVESLGSHRSGSAPAMRFILILVILCYDVNIHIYIG